MRAWLLRHLRSGLMFAVGCVLGPFLFNATAIELERKVTFGELLTVAATIMLVAVVQIASASAADRHKYEVELLSTGLQDLRRIVVDIHDRYLSSRDSGLSNADQLAIVAAFQKLMTELGLFRSDLRVLCPKAVAISEELIQAALSLKAALTGSGMPVSNDFIPSPQQRADIAQTYERVRGVISRLLAEIA